MLRVDVVLSEHALDMKTDADRLCSEPHVLQHASEAHHAERIVLRGRRTRRCIVYDDEQSTAGSDEWSEDTVHVRGIDVRRDVRRSPRWREHASEKADLLAPELGLGERELTTVLFDERARSGALYLA